MIGKALASETGDEQTRIEIEKQKTTIQEQLLKIEKLTLEIEGLKEEKQKQQQEGLMGQLKVGMGEVMFKSKYEDGQHRLKELEHQWKLQLQEARESLIQKEKELIMIEKRNEKQIADFRNGLEPEIH